MRWVAILLLILACGCAESNKSVYGGDSSVQTAPPGLLKPHITDTENNSLDDEEEQKHGPDANKTAGCCGHTAENWTYIEQPNQRKVLNVTIR